MLMTAGLLIATHRALVRPAGRMVWLALAVASAHGLLCTYPEMLPFAGIAVLLLALRLIWLRRVVEGLRPALKISRAALASLVANPASTVRAIHGLFTSIATARADQNWPNLLQFLSPVEYPAGLATLSVWAVYRLGPITCTLLTIPLVIGLVLAWRRASERLALLLALSGSGLLLAYTIATQFKYGWQKTVQFGGVFWVALLPVALIDAYAHPAVPAKWNRRLNRIALVAMFFFFGYATYMNWAELYRSSDRKKITRDWLELRRTAPDAAANRPIVIEGATFAMPHFYSMWSTCFLRENDLLFARRFSGNGGYLHQFAQHETETVGVPPDAAWLVSREWADSFEPNSRWLVSAKSYVLLANSNRVLSSEGLEPAEGMPRSTEGQIALTLQPHSAADFTITLAPTSSGPLDRTAWRISRIASNAADWTQQITGPPPWHIRVPLIPREINRLRIEASPLPAKQRRASFVVLNAGITPAKN